MEHHSEVIVDTITAEDIKLLADVIDSTCVSVCDKEKFISLSILKEKLATILASL
jgi:hypothetical protein